MLSRTEAVDCEPTIAKILFCLASFKLARSISSEFNVWYLDDGTIAGDADTLHYSAILNWLNVKDQDWG
jgi:hypothetical protein